MAKTLLLIILLGFSCGVYSQEKKQISIYTAVADTSPFVVPELSTEQLKKLLAADSALLFDARPHEEWAIGHLPGAINVAPKPGMPMSLYTSDVHEILSIVRGNKSKPLIIYCNGPFCEKTKRVTADLVKEGFTNVMRYQLGTPVWRATGNVLEVERHAVSYFKKDKTAVWIDARDSAVWNKQHLAGAVNLPFNRLSNKKNEGIIKQAKDDGRLPMHDHNTRILVFSDNIQHAAAVAQAITKEAFHNVSYYNGTYAELKNSVRK